MNINIKSLDKNIFNDWAQLRNKIWPDCYLADCQHDFDKYNQNIENNYCIIAYVNNDPVAFLEGRIRDYAEGCTTDHIGYLEGWYVANAFRNLGIGKKLFLKFMEWCKSKNLAEIASDSLLDNQLSQNVHKALGFKEMGTINTT